MSAMCAIAPELHDHDGGEHLLVWGDQGEWMLVDEPCAALLTRIAPGCDVDAAVSGAVRDGMGSEAEVRRDVEAIWRVLFERGLLSGTSVNRSRGPRRISNITLNLTNRCNLRCAWCYNGLRKTGEIPIEGLMGALDRGRACLSESASLIVLGGEPFARFEALVDLLDRAATIFSTPVLVSTNGTLVDEPRARALARRRVEVQVSLDSCVPQEHDLVRGAGTFERSLRGVRTLVAAGVPTILSMVYTSDTWRRFEAYLDMAQALGVREARFIPLRLVGDGKSHRARLPDQVSAFDHLLEVLQRRPSLRSLLGRDYFSILVKQCARSTRRTGCGIGEQVLFIDADGSVYPCPNHVAPSMRLGSLLEQELPTMVETSPVLRGIRSTYRVEHYRGCARCPFRRWCAGDCRGEALAATGSPLSPSVHCEELKVIHLRALWLAARRDKRLRTSNVDLPACQMSGHAVFG